MDWYKAAQVTVDNGSDKVTVISAEPIDAVRAHDGLGISQFSLVEILTAYTEDVTGDQIIKLVDVWPHATQTLQAAQVVPSPVHFNTAAQALVDTKDKVFAHLSSFFDFGTQVSGTVTFTAIAENDSDVTIRSVNQYKTDLDALEAQVSGSVDDVALIEDQVNGAGGLVEVTAQAVADLSTIDATLQGYVSTTLGYHDSVATWHGDVSGWHTTIGGWHTLISGWHTDVSGWKDDAETAANAATAEKLLASQYANHPVDTLIPNTTDYSAFHWKEKAALIAGGTATNSLELGGELPNYYATAQSVTDLDGVISAATQTALDLKVSSASIANVQNTADADKPVSTAQQTALDLKANQSNVSNIDNTSDVNKPISNAVQAALDEIEILALAGL